MRRRKQQHKILAAWTVDELKTALDTVYPRRPAMPDGTLIRYIWICGVLACVEVEEP